MFDYCAINSGSLSVTLGMHRGNISFIVIEFDFLNERNPLFSRPNESQLNPSVN